MISKINCFERMSFYDSILNLQEQKKNSLKLFLDRNKLLSHLLLDSNPINFSSLLLDCDIIKIGSKNDISTKNFELILKISKSLCPWRKGPFSLFDILIESEWASYMKWNRLKKSLPSLKGKTILDIGCSSGYYMFRMADNQPRMIMGIEPYLLYYFQFIFLQHFVKSTSIYCFPFFFEELPDMNRFFDVIFCMGTIYHNKSPLDNLRKIHRFLKPGGTLVLETITIPGDAPFCLFPESTYAKMNNVYFIPTVQCLKNWVLRSGFHNFRHIHTSKTTSEEQRKTPWVNTETLKDFLNSENPNHTVEGYPSPSRSIIFADAKK